MKHLEPSTTTNHAGSHGVDTADSHSEHAAGRHAGHSVADFRGRFWVCLALTVPVIALSPGLPFVGERRLVEIAGLLSPAVGGVLMSASTVIVALNARTLVVKQ